MDTQNNYKAELAGYPSLKINIIIENAQSQKRDITNTMILHTNIIKIVTEVNIQNKTKQKLTQKNNNIKEHKTPKNKEKSV